MTAPSEMQIFLASLIIGLVMLYGQTKDRWNWKKISYYFFIAAGFIVITIYHALNNWKGVRIALFSLNALRLSVNFELSGIVVPANNHHVLA